MWRLTFLVWRWTKTFPFSFGALVATVLLLAAAPARAQGLVEYEFTGVVIDNSGDLGVFGPLGTVQINDTFTGRFSYMTGPGNPDQAPADPELGAYALVDFVIDQAVVPITPVGVGVRHVPPVPTLPPLPPDLGTDEFIVAGTFPLDGNKTISLRLESPYEAVFTDDSLPTSLVLADFTDLQAVISVRALGLPPADSFIDAGQLTSLVQVPEPASIFLLLLSVGGMALMRRSRQPARQVTPANVNLPSTREVRPQRYVASNRRQPGPARRRCLLLKGFQHKARRG